MKRANKAKKATGKKTTTKARNLAIGTGGSIAVDKCQVCNSKDLKSVLFLGYLPPVNTMPVVGTQPKEQPSYPAEMLQCGKCQLVQIGCVVDPEILFPPTYPYTSGTTKILRENFAELYREVMSLYPLTPKDLVVDVGSNDGTLLSNFHLGGHKVLGIEPTNAGKIARKNGIDTMTAFFNKKAAKAAVAKKGKASIVTAANVFAHIEDVHSIVEGIASMLKDDGIFISESHYLVSLLETVQYDTIYHEHLRYYSVTALKYLLESHGLEIIHVKKIPTHGGSVRVYAAKKGKRTVRPTVQQVLNAEKTQISEGALRRFRDKVVQSKTGLHALLNDIKKRGEKVYAVGAPSRASTLINYVGLDDGIIDCVLEIQGSYKIGKYVPGTTIPVLEESKLVTDQPAYALLLSWHIASELIPKLTAKGFRGKFIVPLPNPRIVSSATEVSHVEAAAA